MIPGYPRREAWPSPPRRLVKYLLHPINSIGIIHHDDLPLFAAASYPVMAGQPVSVSEQPGSPHEP